MELLERDSELELLEAVGKGARDGNGCGSVVVGEAGVGKTALVTTAAGAFERDGIRLLRARGGELESDFGFGVVRQLFEPALMGVSVEQRRRLLSGVAAFAAPVLGLGASAPAGPDAVFVAQHGLYWLAVNLAASRPMVLLVDDAHWSDGASLGWLLYLVRRLDGVSLSVLLGWRSGEPGSTSELLEVLRMEPSVRVVSLTGLSLGATSSVVRSRLATADDRFCEACYQATGGNPFLISELVGTLAAGDVPATAKGALSVAELGPEAVSRSVLSRLARLSPDARALAQAVAVLDTDAESRFAAELAGLDADRVAAAAESLVDARIFEDSEVLRFTHPILRASVYADLPAPRRSAEHRRAARGLLELGGDPDRAAVHLLATAPAGKEWVARSLADAAQRALARGAPDAAVALVERALAEPPANDERSAMLLARGLAAFMSAGPDAETALRRAVSEADDPALRAEAAMTLSQLEVGGKRAGNALVTLEHALVELELGDAEEESVGRLELYRITTEAVRSAPWARVQRPLQRLYQVAQPDSWLRRVVAGCLLWQESLRPERPRPEVLAELRGQLGDPRAVAEGTGPLDFVYFDWAMMGLEQVDDLGGARAGLDAAAVVAQKAGHLAGLAPVLATRATVLYGLGELAAAETDARQALQLGPLVGNNVAHDWALGSLCMVLADRGEFEDAERELAAQALENAEPGPTALEARLLIGRAYLRSMEGDHARACADVARYAARLGDYDGGAFGSLPAVCARILAAGGQNGFARVLVTRALKATESTAVNGVLGMALHAAGLLEPGSAAIDLLDQAVHALEHSPRRVELARALTDLGGALRRANRRAAAREPLRRGMDLAHRCGARALAERAREELVATGARPRRLVRSGRDALTPSELRVAELAVLGNNITEIGQALFVTRKTVETHLYAAYRKLDVNTRAGLVAALQANGELSRSHPAAGFGRQTG